MFERPAAISCARYPVEILELNTLNGVRFSPLYPVPSFVTLNVILFFILGTAAVVIPSSGSKESKTRSRILGFLLKVWLLDP